MLMPTQTGPAKIGDVGIEDVPPEAALQAGEQVLWSGRPRVREPHDGKWWRRRITIVAWMLVPIALVVARYSEWAQYYVNIHIVVLLLAILWIAASLNALTLTPLREARRRERTRYILTSDRAIVAELGSRRRRVESMFLDAMHRVSFQQRSANLGDVYSGFGVTFGMIDDPCAVHAIVTGAIRVARARGGGDEAADIGSSDDFT